MDWLSIHENLTVRTKIALLLLIIVIIGGGMFGLIGWIVFKFHWWTLLFIAVVAACSLLSEWISKHSKGKVMKIVEIVLSAPLIFIHLALSSLHPFITIAGTYFCVAMFGFGIPALILTALNKLFGFGLLSETIYFISIALGSILCTNSYKVTKFFIHLSPLRNWGEHRYEGYREKLAIYLIQPENVIFLLYLTYLVLLVLTGFVQIQYGDYLLSEGIDSAILKAFLVFIAFTNMKIKAHDSKLDSQEILQLTMGLFVHDDEDWIRKRYNVKKETS